MLHNWFSSSQILWVITGASIDRMIAFAHYLGGIKQFFLKQNNFNSTSKVILLLVNPVRKKKLLKECGAHKSRHAEDQVMQLHSLLWILLHAFALILKNGTTRVSLFPSTADACNREISSISSTI